MTYARIPALAAFALAMTAMPASAATITLLEPHYSTDHFVPHISFEGPVVVGDLEALSALYDQVIACGMDCIGADGGNTAIVSLDSPGGNYVEGLKIAQFFRDNAIATVVENGKSCYSACAFAFLGGSGYSPFSNIGAYVDRMVRPGSVVGFHAPYVPDEALNELVAELGLDEVLGGNRDSIALMVESLVNWNVDPKVIATMVSMGPDQTYDIATPNDLFLTRSTLPPLPGNVYQPNLEMGIYNACLRLLAIRDGSTPSEVKYALPYAPIERDFGKDHFGNALSGFRLVADDPLALMPDPTIQTHCGVKTEALSGGYDLDVSVYYPPNIQGFNDSNLGFFNRDAGWSSAGPGAVSAKRVFQRGPMHHFLLDPDMPLSDLAEANGMTMLATRFFTLLTPELPSHDTPLTPLAETPTSRVWTLGRLVISEQVGNLSLYDSARAVLSTQGTTITNDATSEISFVREGTFNLSGNGFAWFGFKDGNGGAAVVRIETVGGGPVTDQEKADIRAVMCGTSFAGLRMGC